MNYKKKGGNELMKEKNKNEDVPICHMQNIISDLATEAISKLTDENFSKYEVIQALMKIRSWATMAEVQGQKMEDRLKKYKNSIESLGFVREKS